MAGYLASRIKLGKLDYLAVVTRYPQFKDGIDEILINDGFQDLIQIMLLNWKRGMGRCSTFRYWPMA